MDKMMDEDEDEEEDDDDESPEVPQESQALATTSTKEYHSNSAPALCEPFSAAAATDSI